LGGIVEVSNSQSLGGPGGAGTIVDGGSVGFDEAQADFNLPEGLTLNGAGDNGALRDVFGNVTVTFSGPIMLATTATVPAFSPGATLKSTGGVSGPGGLDFVGGGTLQLDGAAVITGATSVTAGILELNSSAVGGAIHGPLTNGGRVRLLNNN